MAKNFKIAVSSADKAPNTAPLLLMGSIQQNLITASKMGYDAIEIHTRENAPIPYEEILETCRQNHVAVSAVVSGRLAVQESVTMTDNNAEKLEKAISGLYKYIDIAAALKTDLIIGWIRGKVAEQKTLKEYYDLFAGNMKLLADTAKKRNVKLLIEAINRYEINTFNTAEETVSFIEDYGMDNVYVHLDTFHMNIEEVDIAKAILLCREKLGYIHFADSNRWYPGAGHIDFRPIMDALEEIGYDGYLSVECLPHPNGKEAAEKAIQYLKSFK